MPRPTCSPQTSHTQDAVDAVAVVVQLDGRVVGDVAVAPLHERLQHRQQVAAGARSGGSRSGAGSALYCRRSSTPASTRALSRRGQPLPGRAGAAQDLAEPVGAERHLAHDEQRPAVADDVEGARDGAAAPRQLVQTVVMPTRFAYRTNSCTVRPSRFDRTNRGRGGAPMSAATEQPTHERHRATRARAARGLRGGVPRRLDLFIVNIAFPDAGRRRSTPTTGALSWVLNGYTIVFAALLAPAGRIGRPRSAGGGSSSPGSPSSSWVAGLRARAWGVGSSSASGCVQAVGAAMLTATSLALLLHALPAGAPRAGDRASGRRSAVCRPPLGPPIGGLLVEASWRWVFLVNMPVGIAALVVGLRVLPESSDEAETRRPTTCRHRCCSSPAVGPARLRAGRGAGPRLGQRRLRGAVAGAVLAGARSSCGPPGPRAGHRARCSPLPLFRARAFSLGLPPAMAFFMAGFGAMLLGNVLWLTGGWGMLGARGRRSRWSPARARRAHRGAGRAARCRVGCGRSPRSGRRCSAVGRAATGGSGSGEVSGYVTDSCPGSSSPASASG